MFKPLLTLTLLVLTSASALAKPANVYPVTCTILWASVKDTLLNPHNYRVMFSDDTTQRATFVVVGNLTQFTDRVALIPKDGSCELKTTFLEVGSDNDDYRQFHHRLAQALTKLQAAKPEASATGSAQP